MCRSGQDKIRDDTSDQEMDEISTYLVIFREWLSYCLDFKHKKA
jgi:hypothetical protein